MPKEWNWRENVWWTFRPGRRGGEVAEGEAEQVDRAEREGAGDQKQREAVAAGHFVHRLPQHRPARLQ